jgi:hypothetical protein
MTEFPHEGSVADFIAVNSFAEGSVAEFIVAKYYFRTKPAKNSTSKNPYFLQRP